MTTGKGNVWVKSVVNHRLRGSETELSREVMPHTMSNGVMLGRGPIRAIKRIGKDDLL
jgi:hypothetical protein